MLDPPQSRRIWIGAHNGRLYVFSGFMDTTVGRLWKRWPVQAERDGRAVLRIDGKRYERQLLRVESGDGGSRRHLGIRGSAALTRKSSPAAPPANP